MSRWTVKTLELDLDGPSMNLVGFEHVATTEADKAKVESARKQLENPLVLFSMPKAAGCTGRGPGAEKPAVRPGAGRRQHQGRAPP
jgi:hypothetical protein